MEFLSMFLIVLATGLQQQVYSSPPTSIQAAYMIRETVRGVPEAVTLLRRFVPLAQDKNERCQRLAVLLNELNGNALDSFHIVDIGLSRAAQIASKFRSIDIDGLRILYISAINAFLQSQQIDAGLIELVNCLSDKFRVFDAKARSFLNDNELRKIVEQYQRIAGQPLSVLIDPANNGKAVFNISAVGEMNPLIRRTLSKYYSRTNSGKGTRSPFDVSGVDDSQPAAEAPLATEPVSSGQESASVSTSVGEETAKLAAHVEQAPGELNEDARRYLGQMFGAISQVYNTLPLSAKLGDRCQAYNYVINASEIDLSQEAFIKGLVEAADAHIKQAGANDIVSLAGQNERENFLFADSFADEFLTQDSDREVLGDLRECVEHLNAVEPAPEPV